MTAKGNAISTIEDPGVLMQILDRLPTSVFIKNEDLRFVLSNAAHCAIAKAEAEALLGHRSDEFHDADEAEAFMARDRLVLASGQTMEWEETARNAAGEDIPYITRRSRLDAADGKTYLIGTSAKISDIRKREEQYRMLADTVPVGIWQCDEQGQSSYANLLLLKYLGIAAGDLETADIRGIIGGGRAGFPGEACRFEADLVAADGKSRRALVISSGWNALTGSETRSAIVSVVDISEMTELKRVNDEITRLNLELAENMRKLKDVQDEAMNNARMASLGQLTATVAHELRNPMSAVRTAAYLLERKIKGQVEGTENSLKRIASGISRCDNIITQLLDFSRPASLRLADVEIDEWLAAAVAEIAATLPGCVVVECELMLGRRAAKIDRTLMTRMLANLIGNASEAMVGRDGELAKPDAGEHRITVTSLERAHAIEVSVRDNGPGIPEGVAKRIFEPLFTTKNFGTGLGLPAAEKIMRDHGGSLEFEPAGGGGASFIFRFPAQPAREAAA